MLMLHVYMKCEITIIDIPVTVTAQRPVNKA